MDVIIPEFVEEKEIVKRIQCLHCSHKFVKKNFSLRLFLNCSYFSSDFSLNVLIKYVLIKKKKSVFTRYTKSVQIPSTPHSVYPLTFPVYILYTDIWPELEGTLPQL